MQQNPQSSSKPPVWIVLLLCFILGLMYFLVAPEIDRSICYARLSNNLKVSPSPNAIRSALFDGLTSKIEIGLAYEQTISTLDANWPYTIVWRSPDLGGGFKEYILLDNCLFSKNDFSFLFVYAQDGSLTSILNYIDD